MAGAVVAKTVTLQPRAGNAPPTLCARSGAGGGYLNRVGLRNAGASQFARCQLPIVQACGAPVIQSVTAQHEAEIESLLAVFSDTRVIGFELNASCPNAASGQLEDAVLRRVLRRARRSTTQPIWVKLAYGPADFLLRRARICAEEGADGITAINTLPALDVADEVAGLRARAWFRGGLSGPCLRPLAQWAVELLATSGLLPVVACGGVDSVEGVLAFAALGAAAVQVGSVLLTDPAALSRIDSDLAQQATHHGISSWSQLLEVVCLRNKS